MKTVTIREAQHNLGKILLEVEAGATVQITRRRIPLARLVPEPTSRDLAPGVDWSDHLARLVTPRTTRLRPAPDSSAVLEDLRGER